MNQNSKSLYRMAAMVAVAAAGVVQLIDQTSMIVLTVALLVGGRSSPGCGLLRRGA